MAASKFEISGWVGIALGAAISGAGAVLTPTAFHALGEWLLWGGLSVAGALIILKAVHFLWSHYRPPVQAENGVSNTVGNYVGRDNHAPQQHFHGPVTIQSASGNAMLDADESSVINFENAQLHPALAKMFPNGFAKASTGSLIHAQNIRFVEAAATPERDVWLQDAVCYAVHGRWLGANEQAFNDDAQMGKAGAIAEQMRQLAYDGKFNIWGKASPVGVFELIPQEFWAHHQIDFLRLVGDEAQHVKTERTGPNWDYSNYSELMVSRAQTEARWPPL